MHRSEITIDLGAVRRNVGRLREALGTTELWAVVKADGYGHGALDVSGAALGEGAAGALRGDGRRGASAAGRVSGRAHSRHGAELRPGDRAGA